LPLLRVDDRFLISRYGNMDLLTWLACVVLERRSNHALVQSGQLSPGRHPDRLDFRRFSFPLGRHV
jgi:hypothetical protein